MRWIIFLISDLTSDFAGSEDAVVEDANEDACGVTRHDGNIGAIFDAGHAKW